MIKKLLKIILILVVFVLVVAIGYVGYVLISYHRLDDNIALEANDNDKASLSQAEIDHEYTIVTQNIGFGAYSQDYTFFMDGGKESWARSKESVVDLVTQASDKVQSFNPDFVLFQEVDLNSTRSYHINEYDLLKEKFSNYSSIMAVNYDSPFLMYPLTQPHGKSNSSIVTFSTFKIETGLRRSLPISNSLSKLVDLDRCYSITRIPTANGKELVIFNVHLSAYGGSDEIRRGQTTMLFSDMQKEYEKGNYCVCGGDFNHDFTGDSTQKLNGGEQTDFGWAQPFPMEIFSEYTGLTRVTNYNNDELNPTCRNCDVPYVEGNEVFIVDGFIVSNNVEVTFLENVVTGFVYSDHNPVVMKFVLK